ncbi:DUF6600 domain-containing protein [Rhodanobacter umsongensis]|uniref:DUF6600 domain-containing protein n=1 Tax=Rhodanobacter umsongensis TaxID=633153 RepID=A0ABW0JMN0_9GAMM
MRELARFFNPYRSGWRVLALLLLCAATSLAQAQSAGDDDNADPPSRVARLSYISGDLGLLPAGAKEWSDASVNRPLTSGDRLSTGRDARAELELGGASLRMDGQTDFGLLDLNDQLAQIELTRGTLNVTVRTLDAGQTYEIDTPTVALVIDQPGTFRVDIDDNGSSARVTASDGGATVYGDNNAQRTIHPGRSYRFVDSSLAAVAISDIGRGDAFDAWSSGRDRRYASSNSGRYVSDDVVGYQDLDQYGDWQDTDDYGAVWYPTHVAADWAPYRDGHWAYIAPWGWTWVDDSPWGFAPYHYGRWAYTHRGWGWMPGPRGVRPIYAPALVAFVGGGGWSVGSGPVGWFPLGPGEIYDPWYRCGRRCYTDVNIRNMRDHRGHDRRADIDDHYNRYRNGTPSRGDHYANRDKPRGFTAVPGSTFTAGRHVQHNLARIDPRRLAAAPLVSRDANELRPPAGGAQPSRNPHVRNLRSGGFDREVVARHAPPTAVRDARGAGRDGREAGASGTGLPAPGVRVLNPRDGLGRGATDRAGGDRVGDNDVRRPGGWPQQRPGGTRIGADTPAQGRHDNRADAQVGGALPSARFARPRDSANADRRAAMPRPGVSYMSGADDSHGPTRPAFRSSSTTLPQAPQILRADPRNRPGRANDEPGQRYAGSPAMRPMPTESGPPVRTSAPRFQRSEPAPRSYVREQPQPQPMQAPPRYEPARPSFQQPRYQRPQPREEAPRPQRSESRPGQKAAPRARDDAPQH